MKIIIGASGGIGSKLFYHYSQYEAVVGTFLKNGEPTEYMYQVDIGSPKCIENFVNEIDFYDGKVTLINCAGVNYDCMAHKADTFDWDEVIDINLIGTFRVIRALLPFMRKKNYGRIINMGSVVAQMGVAGTSAYAASKSGLWGMTKAIAEENKAHNISINTLNLGYINAGMTHALQIERFGLVGDVQNTLNAIDFLVDSPFVTGTSIDINGGII